MHANAIWPAEFREKKEQKKQIPKYSGTVTMVVVMVTTKIGK